MPPRAGAVRLLAPFLVAQRQQHPEAESSSTGQSPSGQPRPPPTSGPAPPLPSLPHRPGLPARSARGPGVRARVPAWGCAPEPSSDPRPRPAQDRPGIPARAPRPTSPATGLQPCTRRALQEDGRIGGRQRCRRGECGGAHARRPLPAAPHAAPRSRRAAAERS